MHRDMHISYMYLGTDLENMALQNEHFAIYFSIIKSQI